MYTSFILLSAAALAAVFDLKTSKIPNMLSFTAFAALCLTGGLSGGPSAFGQLLGRAALVCLALFPFFAFSALGAGDIKLLAALSAGIPPGKTLLLLFASFLWGAALGLFGAAARGEGAGAKAHLAPAIFLGVSTVLIL